MKRSGSISLIRNKVNNPSVRACWIIIITMSITSLVKGQDHLLLSEITLQTAEAEFIEIFNPTDEEKMLEDYYLADNQNYPLVTSIPMPFVDLGDFIVRFPNETFLAPNQVVVVAMNGVDFENHYGQLPDFEIVSAHDSIPDMVSINQDNPAISNAGEGIALFFWNGNDDLMQDVDLMNAGIPDENSEILDKSDLPGYQTDAHTIPYQISAAGPGFSTKRIMFEGMHEIHEGGNGILFDDETSESIGITWDVIYTAPTPGTTDLMTTGLPFLDSNFSDIQSYPNPTLGEVNFLLNHRAGEIELFIYNEMGELVKSKRVFAVSSEDEYQVDLTGFDSGVYFISVFSKNIGYELIRVVKY